ncbi:MAG: hypothetical protein ACLQVG_02790 [Terriglobia bacterium]
MRFYSALIAVAAFLLLTSAAASQTKHLPAKAKPIPSMFGRNLLKNGNVEADTEDNKKVPDWSPADGFTVAKYGSNSGEWDWGLSGCTGCDNYYVRLAFEGKAPAPSTSQTVDVSAAAAKIDQKIVTAAISAYLGGFQNADTTSTLTASFQDAAGKELGTLQTQPVNMTQLPKAERGSTGLRLCENSGPVPAGTKKIVFTWSAKTTGTSGDYLALGDNFSLVLNIPKQ